MKGNKIILNNFLNVSVFHFNTKPGLKSNKIILAWWPMAVARVWNGQISRNLNITRQSVWRWILSKHNFENFPARGRFSKKQKIFFSTFCVFRLP